MAPALPLVSAAIMAAQRNTPVLCVDTCSLLDVLRGPLRPGGARTIAAANDLLVAEQAGRLTLFITNSMLPEFARNELDVRKELARYLLNLDDSIQATSDCLQQCGLPATSVSFSHSSLATQLDAKYVTAFRACHVLDDDDDAKSRAMDRVVKRLRPSRKGSALDANIIEHYLGLGAALLAASSRQPFVFVSSNTNDYCEAGVLHQDLTADFRAVRLEYASTLPWAKKALGL